MIVEIADLYIAKINFGLMITETKIIFNTLFYSFLKNYSTSASNILREAFYHNYLQTV